ncbi:hypothetical protein GCM10010278_74020 [Streptomyces melanogenes]|nr:hypothetical protein GCM10010278_74020 [Streptomyces melanogenes]
MAFEVYGMILQRCLPGQLGLLPLDIGPWWIQPLPAGIPLGGRTYGGAGPVLPGRHQVGESAHELLGARGGSRRIV